MAVVPTGLGPVFSLPGAEAPGYWQPLLRRLNRFCMLEFASSGFTHR